MLVYLGNGVITSRVSLQSSSFHSDPPTFTLVGDSVGGPPTNYTWRRNGEVITANSSYNISIAVNNGEDRASREQAHYTSTLVVTGIFPGRYEYSVSNPATSTPVTSYELIEGNSHYHYYNQTAKKEI